MTSIGLKKAKEKRRKYERITGNPSTQIIRKMTHNHITLIPVEFIKSNTVKNYLKKKKKTLTFSIY